jgi:DNA-binding transcriptional LysR family regulator
VELRHLRYFVAVAEELNYRRAAARLNIAAPPLSVQISRLEAEIGADLFVREGRGIKLTDAGATFLGHARRTLLEANRGIEAARQTASGEMGEISIGHNMPAGFLVFPKVVPAFRRQWPKVRLTFHSLNIPQQLEGLRRGQLDVGVVWLPVPSDEFDVRQLMEEPIIAVLPADHPLASAPFVSVADLAREPLILLNRAMDEQTYQQIERMFADAGAAMNVAYQLENSLAMINFVAMGSGCSLLPAYVRSIRQEGVVFKDLRHAGMSKTLALIKLKGASALAEKFADFTAASCGAGKGSFGPQSPRSPAAQRRGL